jgi:hypothetical protein
LVAAKHFDFLAVGSRNAEPTPVIYQSTPCHLSWCRQQMLQQQNSSGSLYNKWSISSVG